MKKILCVAMAAASLCACKKENNHASGIVNNDSAPLLADVYVSAIQKYVRDHPHAIRYDAIDFNNYRLSKQKACWYLRLALKTTALSNDFVLLQTDSVGNTFYGRIVHLQKADSPSSATGENYNGSISIHAFESAAVVQSRITNGFIEAFHPALFNQRVIATHTYNKESSFPVPYDYDLLPEVVVVGYRTGTSATGLSVSDMMMLQSMFGYGYNAASGGGGGNGGSGGGDNAGYWDAGYGVYNTLNGNFTEPSPDGSNNPASPQTPDKNNVIQPEESYARPAIDLDAWMKCFSGIPDEGAASSITLYGDLPIEGNNQAGMNVWSGNTGHCFLSLSKANGAQSITQVIGFTAQSAGQAIISADNFVPSKIVDNAGHKYNCSIKMNLTPAGLHAAIERIKLMSGMAYSIVNFDCLDFGLDILNTVRDGNKLTIDKTYDPHDMFSNVANGPKLYKLLSDMIETGSPESPNILLTPSQYIGKSHGPCN